MFLSVIIPTCHRNEMLGLCLERLAPGRQTLDMANYEVIVTDDSEGIGAEDYCKTHFPFVKYTRGPRRGPAANRNNGARLAANNWLIFLDDDCLPESNILKAYYEQIIRNSKSRVFEGAISAIGKQVAFNEECPINETGGNLWSCNFCINKKIFFHVGGFDEEFPYPAMEDIDLRLRIQQQYPIIFCPDAKVFHPWKKISNPFKRFNHAFYAHIIFLRKWPIQVKNFGLIKNTKKAVFHFIHHFLPNLISFKFRGIPYVLAYYFFLFRLSMHHIKK